MFKKNKNERTFKYIDDEATVLYRALDKDGNIVCESMVLEDILEECESLKGITYEKQEVFTVTDGFQPFKPKKNKKPSEKQRIENATALEKAKTDNDIKIANAKAEADANRELDKSLTPAVLKARQIEALTKAQVIYVPYNSSIIAK